MLSIEGLSVSYGRVNALRGLDLEVRKGEIVGLIGPNGAGKSTTMKAIFGLVAARAGEITFEGASLLGGSPEDIVRRGLSLVPEGRHIFQSLTVAENLMLGRAGGAEADQALLDQLLDERFPALRRYYSEPAAGLSGGEQQQLAIARALLAKPRLLLLDEPSLGLAPLMVVQVFDVLRELRDQGVTVLLVEQNATQAIALADRTYVLRTGDLVMHGTREELQARNDIQDAYLGTVATP